MLNIIKNNRFTMSIKTNLKSNLFVWHYLNEDGLACLQVGPVVMEFVGGSFQMGYE